MKIKLHDEAKKNITKRVNELLFLLCPRPCSARQSSFPDTGIISEDITDKAISHIIGSEIDYSGRQVAIFFKFEDKEIGLFNESFISLVKVAEDIQKSGDLYSMVSIKYIYEIIFEWMTLKYEGSTQKDVVDYFFEKCEKDIQLYEMWVPIAHTIIEGELQVGTVKITNLSKTIFDTWETAALNISTNESHRITLQKYYEKERKEKQGFAVAVIEILGEKKRAEEMAFEQVEQALSMISIFTPCACFINHVSYSTIKGKSFVERVENYLVNDGHINIHMKSTLDHRPIDWVIERGFLERLKNELNAINTLLLIKNKNQYQEKVINSISLFARSTLMKNIPDKLVYIFASLESILIRNETEPIQQNLADRIAFAITLDGSVRLRIVKNIKDAYKFRSKFVHHGLGIKEMDIFNEFLHYSLVFYFYLLSNINNFSTKDEMINAVEKRKYGIE